MVTNIVEVRGVRNQFGAQVVHDGLDLDLRRGEILSVVGGSGTGKSVLLRTIVGLNRPAAGSVTVFGEDLLNVPVARRRAIERRFGVLFQKGALFSSLTVAENVALPMIEHAGLPAGEAAELAALKIALAGLPAGAGAKYPSDLSGGMVKRAALARALALDPDILFLDEPTAGLDWRSAQELLARVNALWQQGHTIILVSHDIRLVAQHAPQTLVMHQGRVLAHGPTAEVLARDDVLRQAQIRPPQVRLLAQSLADRGIPANTLATETFAEACSPLLEVRP